MNNIAKDINSLSSPDPVSGNLHSTKMKPLLSSNLPYVNYVHRLQWGSTIFLLHSVLWKGKQLVSTVASVSLTPPRRRLCDQVGLSVVLSVRLCAASCKKLCIDLHENFTKGRSWPSPKVILFWWWSGFWLSQRFRGRSRPARSFCVKIDCSAETVTDGRSYYRTLIGSRGCSVQWRYPRWPWSTFQGQTRRQ